MKKNKLIKKVRNSINRIEMGNSQTDIICQYIEEYFYKTKKPNQKKLEKFLIDNSESFEMGNSQFEILLDFLKE